MRRARLALAALAAFALAGGEAGASVRLYSYDPADQATREASGPLTFQFNQTLTLTRVMNVRSTEGEATADLKPADERALGAGGLARLIGAKAKERDLYAITPGDEGDALTSALCPGSKRAWLAMSRPRRDRDLQVFVLGDDPAGGPARRCAALAFTFHGEWRLPAGAKFDERQLERPNFPR